MEVLVEFIEGDDTEVLGVLAEELFDVIAVFGAPLEDTEDAELAELIDPETLAVTEALIRLPGSVVGTSCINWARKLAWSSNHSLSGASCSIKETGKPEADPEIVLVLLVPEH